MMVMYFKFKLLAIYYFLAFCFLEVPMFKIIHDDERLWEIYVLVYV